MVEQQLSGVSSHLGWENSETNQCMGITPVKNYEMVMLVLLKGDNHDCSIRVSNCSIRVSRSLLRVGSHGPLSLSMNPTTPMCLLKYNCACAVQIMAKINLS